MGVEQRESRRGMRCKIFRTRAGRVEQSNFETTPSLTDSERVLRKKQMRGLDLRKTLDEKIEESNF